MRRGTMLGLTVSALLCHFAPARAADLIEPYAASGPYEAEMPPPPRYFPRAEGDDSAVARVVPVRRRVVRCRVWQVPIPTDAPGDPSYVGSAYGLGKPSYYGFTPPLGVDDPYGRSILPPCP